MVTRPDRRNPWLLLGIDYASAPAEASAAFAARSQVVRHDGAGPWELHDLTWALHEIEAMDGDPLDSVRHFRSPADAAAYHDAPPPAEPVELPAGLAPAAPRSSSDADLLALLDAARRRAVGADSATRLCPYTVVDEPVVDEPVVDEGVVVDGP